MVPSSSIYLLALLHLIGHSKAQCGNEVRERKAWNKLTSREQTTFLEAVIALKQHDGSPINGTSVPSYDAFVHTHDVNVYAAHSLWGNRVEKFLTWHRWFLWKYESALTAISGKCAITLPYWEWELDSEDQDASAPLESYTFGSANGILRNGPPSERYVVTEGIAACNSSYWSTTVGTGDCLQRFFRHGTFTSQAGLLDRITSYTLYEDFLRPLEGTPHAVPHNWVGGHMANVRYSPDDPLFYLHHANVDRVFALWQDYHDHDLVSKANLGADHFSPGLDAPHTFHNPENTEQAYFLFNNAYPTPREVLLNNDLIKVTYVDDSLAEALKNALASDGDATNDYAPNPEWFTLPGDSSPSPTTFTPLTSVPTAPDPTTPYPTTPYPTTAAPTTPAPMMHSPAMPSPTTPAPVTIGPGSTPPATATPTVHQCGAHGTPCFEHVDCCNDNCRNNECRRAGPPVWANSASQAHWEGLIDQGMSAKAAIHQLAVIECGPGNPIQVPQSWIDQTGIDEKFLRCYVEDPVPQVL